MPSLLTPIDGAAPLIAEAAPADAVALAALFSQALPPGWPEGDLAASCADPNRTVLKAADGPEALGLLILQHAAGEAEVLALAVAEERRRQGIAASLLRQGISFCQAQFIACIYLEVAESNASARALYEKFGFAVIGRRKNYYQSSSRCAPETAILMRRDAKLPVTVDLEKSCT